MRDLLGQRIRLTARGNPVGCNYCSLKGKRIPVLGLARIRGRRAMLWAQNPGRVENELSEELRGPVGKYLWERMERVGLRREDFDIQNVVRCYPGQDQTGADLKPDKTVIACCSLYNEEALERNRGRAVVHAVFGEVAGQQLLGTDYRKDRPLIWKEAWNAYVVIADHPGYPFRQRGSYIEHDFDDRLKTIAIVLKHPGRWGYLLTQDYGATTTPGQMAWLGRKVRAEAAAGRRITVDLEEGEIGGQQVALMIGIGWGHYQIQNRWDSWKGGARSVVLFHPEAIHSRSRIEPLVVALKSILEDPNTHKTFQHGPYDVPRILDLLDIRIQGYDFDTQYASYLHRPNLRTYSLDSIANRSHPEFSDYKAMMEPYAGNLALAPLKTLVLYNCADCDLPKRIEERTAPFISLPLLQVYIHDAFTLDAMEQRGPLLDWEAHAQLSKEIEPPLQELHEKLCQAAGRPDFNPGSPAQIGWLLFDKLKLDQIDGRKTGDDILALLLAQTKSPVVKWVRSYRLLNTMKNTFLKGYAASAKRNGGELRTIWWLTGAATGRLRSGKGDRAEAEGIVNFQNLHGNPLLQNLLVSDANWKRALEE